MQSLFLQQKFAAKVADLPLERFLHLLLVFGMIIKNVMIIYLNAKARFLSSAILVLSRASLYLCYYIMLCYTFSIKNERGAI